MSPTKILVGQGCLVVSIVAGGLWASTQWTAAMLGNQPRPESPFTTIIGQPIYAPSQLFEWWYAYEAYEPPVLRKARMFCWNIGRYCWFPLAGTADQAGHDLWLSPLGQSRSAQICQAIFGLRCVFREAGAILSPSQWTGACVGLCTDTLRQRCWLYFILYQTQ